ncbi:hypothetical protein ALC57_11215, partial [Trachymyrmex cornetzi]
RCCKRHQNNNLLTKEATNDIEVKSDYSTFSDETLCELLGNLRSVAAGKGFDFDYPPALTNSDYYNLTGLKKDQFNFVANCIKKHIKSISGRSYRTCIALLLTKVRTGLSISILSTLFTLSKRRAGRTIAAARIVLMSSFVPNFLRTNHISHEDFVSKHTTAIAKTLFIDRKDACILVADGTYMQEKSSNYRFQRRTYSVHKGRPLVKSMIIVNSTRYTKTIFGHYFVDGKNNDANILITLVRSDASELLSYLKTNVFVVDCGFRDCLKLLEDLGFITKMPHFLKDGSQHTFSEANEEELTQMTIGSYQIKQAQSYTEEHIADDGIYQLFIHRQERNIIRLQLQSRHTSSKVYNL